MKKMSRFLLIIVFSLLTYFAFSSRTTYAAENVLDDAGLLTNQQIAKLESRLAEAQQQTKATFMIATSYDLDQDDPRYAVDRTLGDTIGNDENGILLYLDMTGRQVYISTSGNMIHYMTDSRIEDTLDAVYDNGLSSEEYYQAFNTFIDETLYYFNEGIPSGHYTIDEATGKVTMYRTITLFEGGLAFLGALILSGIFFFVVKSRYQLKKPSYEYEYRQQGQLTLIDQKDQLTNSFVTTRRIPRSEKSGGGGGGSTTHSSGGGTFGGGSRGF